MHNEPLTWLEIDLAAIRQNVATLKSLVPATTKFLAVVKSNAYGHGLIPVARAAVDAGADWLGVVAMSEALLLRATNLTVPIVVLGYTDPADWTAAADQSVRVLIATAEQLAALHDYRGPRLIIHLKVETGLGRLGFVASNVPAMVDQIRSLTNVELEGVSSHFASVEEQDLAYTQRQVDELLRATDGLGSTVIRHIAATAAILQLPTSHFDLVRAGIGIYGLWPSEGVSRAVEQTNPAIRLIPALSWQTRLVQTKIVESDQSIGYGRTHRVTTGTIVGVLPIGYADGYDRRLSNTADVLIRSRRVPVIGRVAMNMCMVNLSTIPDARVGDIATLIGRDGDEEITADDLALWGDTINYEIVTRIPNHVHRNYLNQ